MDSLKPELRAWPSHIHEMGQCMRGARAIATALGLDYEAFVFEGLPLDVLRATGNAFALQLADYVEQQEAERGSE